MSRVKLNFSLTSMLSMHILKLVELRIKQFFSERLLIDIPALFFLQRLSNKYLWQPIFLKTNFLANRIGFCTESVCFHHLSCVGSHLLCVLGICCAYLATICSTYWGSWDMTLNFLKPKQSVLRSIVKFYSEKSSEHRSKGLLYFFFFMSTP